MRHVAAPEDIYQGTTESCNVSVIERDLAMTNPGKYVDIVRQAVSEGVMHTVKGDVKLDVHNLKMRDSSGRDLAGRIFQTAALHAEFWPTKNFENTPDGIGRLLPGDKAHNKGSDNEVPFTGLLPAELADIRYKMTGLEKATTFIHNERELKDACNKNGVPMTMAVDATAPPFNASPHSDHRPNHVVTIVGVIEGQPRKYLIQNQWGMKNDHSTPDTAVSESDLIKNMTGPEGDAAGEALVPGDHTRVIANGNAVADYNFLEDQRHKRYDLELGKH